MRQILVTGESHIGPIRRGVGLLPDASRGRFVFWPLGGGGALRRPCHIYNMGSASLTTTSPRWENRVFSRETIGSLGIGTMMFLSMPLNTSRILRDYAWDKFAPSDLAETETPLSQGMVEKLIDLDASHALNLTKDLSRVWPDLVVVEAPRFFENASYLSKHRFNICQYIDAAYRRRVKATLTKWGIAVLEQPSVTVTGAGTTDLAYDNENPLDQHHANAAYGKLVLQQMISYADAS